MNTTAKRLKEGMELRGLKQADMVERTGISKGALSSYLSGRYIPKQNNIYLLAKALNVNEAWLMGADVPMEKEDSFAGNKEIMAKNIRHYMSIFNVTQTEICNTLGIKMPTFSDWVNAKTYPRIDKIELMANYFGISKADLVEEHTSLTKKDTRDIEKILDQTREQLTSQEGLMFEGEPATPEAVDSILAAMQVGMEMAKLKNKEKYTPKKYKKD